MNEVVSIMQGDVAQAKAVRSHPLSVWLGLVSQHC